MGAKLQKMSTSQQEDDLPDEITINGIKYRKISAIKVEDFPDEVILNEIKCRKISLIPEPFIPAKQPKPDEVISNEISLIPKPSIPAKQLKPELDAIFGRFPDRTCNRVDYFFNL